LKGSKKLCYGQISLYKNSNKIYMEKNHTTYCNNIVKNISDNTEDTDNEIFKKYKLEEYLLNKIENSPLISFENFSKETKTKYSQLNCNFTIFPSSCNYLYKKLRNNSGLFNIDNMIKNKLTLDKYILWNLSIQKK